MKKNHFLVINLFNGIIHSLLFSQSDLVICEYTPSASDVLPFSKAMKIKHYSYILATVYHIFN